MKKLAGKKLIVILVALLLFALSEAALAQNRALYFGGPIILGNGCPLGSYRTSVSSDGTEFTILFSQFTAETEPGRTVDWANCNIAVPIDIPPGLSLSLVGVDYRGFTYIPSGAMAYISREYFFAGETAPKKVDTISGFFLGEFLTEDDLSVYAWSECGDSTIARSNATIMVRKASPYAEDASISVFSEDWDVTVDKSVVFYFNWRPCS